MAESRGAAERDAPDDSDEEMWPGPGQTPGVRRPFNAYRSYFRDTERGRQSMAALLLAPDPRVTHFIDIDVMALSHQWPELAHGLLGGLADAPALLQLAADAAVAEQKALRKAYTEGHLCNGQRLLQIYNMDVVDDSMMKPYVRVRLVNVPPSSVFHKRNISDFRTEDVGRVVVVRGTVVREGGIRYFQRYQIFPCTSCGNQRTPSPSPAVGNAAAGFPKCPRCKKACNMSLTDINQQANPELRDCQELRLQDHVTQLSPGAIPRAISVYAEDALAGQCKAGDDVIVTGVLLHRWTSRPGATGRRPAVELVVEANSLRVNNEDKTQCAVHAEDAARFEGFWNKHQNSPLKGRDLIVSALCPVYGMHQVKLGLALTLVGGLGHGGTADEGSSRGESHMLLVGDPGTGKSQFLQAAARLCGRSVMTTGIGSTSAGLTASCVKDQGEWVLEAGALVMADGGVCCIDEFGTIPDGKHMALHEAMEQQTISIAKAGLVTKLSSRCTVVAACNPKKKDQRCQGGVELTVGVATPLLSRFDIIMVLADHHDEAWDSNLADFLLGRAEQGYQVKNDSPVKAESSGNDKTVDCWDIPTLRAYFAWLRRRKSELRERARAGDRDRQGETLPLSAHAATLLQHYYNRQRSKLTPELGTTAKSRRTVRMLESLIRLSQAHCILMNGEEVGLRDAAAAVLLVEQSSDRLDGGDTGPAGGVLHSVESADPDRDMDFALGDLVYKLDLEYHPIFRPVLQGLCPGAARLGELGKAARAAAARLREVEEAAKWSGEPDAKELGRLREEAHRAEEALAAEQREEGGRREEEPRAKKREEKARAGKGEEEEEDDSAGAVQPGGAGAPSYGPITPPGSAAAVAPPDPFAQPPAAEVQNALMFHDGGASSGVAARPQPVQPPRLAPADAGPRLRPTTAAAPPAAARSTSEPRPRTAAGRGPTTAAAAAPRPAMLTAADRPPTAAGPAPPAAVGARPPTSAGPAPPAPAARGAASGTAPPTASQQRARGLNIPRAVSQPKLGSSPFVDTDELSEDTEIVDPSCWTKRSRAVEPPAKRRRESPAAARGGPPDGAAAGGAPGPSAGRPTVAVRPAAGAAPAPAPRAASTSGAAALSRSASCSSGCPAAGWSHSSTEPSPGPDSDYSAAAHPGSLCSPAPSGQRAGAGCSLAPSGQRPAADWAAPGGGQDTPPGSAAPVQPSAPPRSQQPCGAGGHPAPHVPPLPFGGGSDGGLS
eukprot:TRINITY_DN17060_c0_g1_i2.p1 TRINITY_DN17060_c0_g1~~TRINITY_DN17060_c0_g1_i2.p1  ORF type:complete len:1254 (+),score=284.41 TRINITY_DN17060_c0_g1_i2:75-3764(+)